MKNELQNRALEIALTTMSTHLTLRNVEFFPFFGTLLGLVREGKPIASDDDVDFYVNISDYENVKSLLKIMRHLHEQKCKFFSKKEIFKLGWYLQEILLNNPGSKI